MSRPGVRPLTAEELAHPLRGAFAVLPEDAGRALSWLRRGPLGVLLVVARTAAAGAAHQDNDDQQLGNQGDTHRKHLRPGT